MASLTRIYYQFTYPIRNLYWYIYRPRTQSVKCLIACQDSFLFIRNTYGKKYWTFPGGRVRTWIEESPHDAVIREVWEETGIEIKDIKLLGEYSSRRRHRHDSVCCFYAEVCDAEIKIDQFDILEARWFKKNKLPDHLSFAVGDVLKLYTDWIKKNK